MDVTIYGYIVNIYSKKFSLIYLEHQLTLIWLINVFVACLFD